MLNCFFAEWPTAAIEAMASAQKPPVTANTTVAIVVVRVDLNVR